jgi:hypothetical protein
MKFTGIFKEKGDMLRKMWINQFAFSLFGIFVASPFNAGLCTAAGVFSYLFYLSVVSFAILDDSQKDRIAFNAGRKKNVSSVTGVMYSFAAFIPTLVLTIVHLAFSFMPMISENITKVIYLINRFVLCGEIIGIDSGITNIVTVNYKPVVAGPEWAGFMSEHGIFQLLFAVLSVVIFGIVYYLGFKGIISINTTETKKNQ